MLLDFRKPNVYVLEKHVSWSGVYMIFFGSHYHKGHSCFVFGASSKRDGVITMHHYNTSVKGCLAPKAQCETDWRKFKERMLAKPESEETDDSRIPRPWERQ